MISRITTLQDSDVQFSTLTTIQSILKKKKQTEMWPIKREKKNLTEKTHEDDQMVNLLDRDF